MAFFLLGEDLSQRWKRLRGLLGFNIVTYSVKLELFSRCVGLVGRFVIHT